MSFLMNRFISGLATKYTLQTMLILNLDSQKCFQVL